MAGASFVVLALGSQIAVASTTTDRIAERRDARLAAISRTLTNKQPEPRKTPSSNPPSNPPSDSPSQDSVRARILELVNQERNKNGLQPLVQESHLEQAAQKHAEDMKKRDYFDHNTPEGKTPTDQIRDAGYPLSGTWYTGQNIAQGQDTPEDVMHDWMNSSGHRKNILSKNFREIGVGYYQNTWVQDFGAHN